MCHSGQRFQSPWQPRIQRLAGDPRRQLHRRSERAGTDVARGRQRIADAPARLPRAAPPDPSAGPPATAPLSCCRAAQLVGSGVGSWGEGEGAGPGGGARPMDCCAGSVPSRGQGLRVTGHEQGRLIKRPSRKISPTANEGVFLF